MLQRTVGERPAAKGLLCGAKPSVAVQAAFRVKGEIYEVGRLCGHQIASTKVPRTPTSAANLHEGKRGSRSSHGRLHEGFCEGPKPHMNPRGLHEGLRESQAPARTHANSKLLATQSGDLFCFALRVVAPALWALARQQLLGSQRGLCQCLRSWASTGCWPARATASSSCNSAGALPFLGTLAIPGRCPTSCSRPPCLPETPRDLGACHGGQREQGQCSRDQALQTCR